MTVTVSKAALNVREELNALKKPSGLKGEELLRANTVSDVYRAIGSVSGVRNLVQNGDFKIAQRGAVSFTGGQGGIDQAYSLDRWYNGYYYNGGNFSPAWTISQQVDHPLGTGTCMQIYTDTAANPGAALLNQLSIQQTFEAQNIFHVAGVNAPPTTLSFWVKSNKPGTYGVHIRMRAGASNPIIMKRYQIHQAGAWEYKTITFPPQNLAAMSNSGNGTGGFISFTLSGAWNKNADSGIGYAEDVWYQYSSNAICFVEQSNLVSTVGNYFRLTDVQWEVGSVATPFERRSIQTELALCQRYYQRHPYYGVVGQGQNTDRNSGSYVAFPVPMRTTPATASRTMDQDIGDLNIAYTPLVYSDPMGNGIGFRLYRNIATTTTRGDTIEMLGSDPFPFSAEITY